MKFMNFSLSDDPAVRLGLAAGDRAVDLTAAGRAGTVRPAPPDTLIEAIRAGNGLEPLEAALEAISADALQEHSHPLDAVRIAAPVPAPQKVLGIGLNYHDHAEEVGMEKPREPFLFAMFANTVVGPDEPIVIPAMSDKIDYEAEMGVIIGRRGRHIPVEEAMDHVAGYTIVNDVSARDLQFKDSQWIRGKSFDTFLPMGPVIVGSSTLGDGDGLDIALRLNGDTMQRSNTSNLIFKVADLVSYISRILTLEPGDVIATGTPGGVGFTRKPPVYLKEGDVVEIDLEGVGTLRNPVVREAR